MDPTYRKEHFRGSYDRSPFTQQSIVGTGVNSGPTRNGPSFYLPNQTGHSNPIARHQDPQLRSTHFIQCGKNRLVCKQQPSYTGRTGIKRYSLCGKHMKAIREQFLAILLITFASSAVGNEWVQYSMPELVQKSDIIVVGVATNEKGKIVVSVSEVLKGENADQLVLTSTQIGFGDVVTPTGKKGIHFLRIQGPGYAPFHPSCYKTMEEVEAVKAVLVMFADPGPYMDLKQKSENPDIVFVLGEVFAGWSVSSKEVPSLTESMTRFADKYYEAAPWVDDLVVTLECEADINGVVRVTSAQPAGPLAQFFEERLLTASRWSYVKNALKPQFRVTLDACIPRKVGSANCADAVQYLRGRLKSADPNIVASALLALAKMRDRCAVPSVIPLLQHKEREVQVKAIQFLGWSRSKLAAKSLCEMLDAGMGGYPKNHDISDAVAVSLKQIDAEESLPALERAACQGVQRAIEAVGAIGRTESFELMLEAARRDPRRCAYMVNGFYWLVRRSNKKTEDWMSNSTWSEDIGIAKISKWVAWWDSNRKDFRVTKSQREAIEQKKKNGT